MATKTRVLKSFETFFIESYNSSYRSDFFNKKTSDLKIKNLFYGESGEFNFFDKFYGENDEFDFFDKKFIKKTFKYTQMGDDHILVDQYFSKNLTKVALELFNRNEYGTFWDGCFILFGNNPKVALEPLIKEYVSESLIKLKEIDEEATIRIFETLGQSWEIGIEKIINILLHHSLIESSPISWAKVIGQTNSLILPVAYCQWNGNSHGLLCEGEDSLIYIYHSSS